MKGMRWKIIAAIMTVIIAVCFIFTNQLINYTQVNLEEKILAKEESARLLTQTIMAQISKQYQTRIKGFVSYKAVQAKEEYIKAFANRDAEELLRLSKPFFQIFKEENPYFASLAWVLTDNKMFLRVHKPELTNDNISSYRPDIVHANRERKPISGFNVGSYGMQFRFVQPVFYHDQYIGVVQFGIKASLFIDTLQKQLDMPAGMAVLNEECKNEKISLMPKFSCDKYSIRARDVSLFQEARELFNFDQNRQQITSRNKQYIVLNALVLTNYEDKSIGKMIIAMDISKDLAAKRSLILSAVALAVGISLVSFLILYFSIGVLLKRIISLNESLKQSNKTLEDRVKDRTQSLEQEIRKQVATEKELLSSKRRYQTLFNNAGDGISIHDLDGNFISVNNELCTRLGYSHAEILDFGPQHFMHQEDVNLMLQRIKQLVEKGKIQFETEHFRKDGSAIPTEIQANIIEFDGKQAIISVARDISDRKRGEEEKKALEAQLRRSKKMKAIGLMAGGVAHDLNNILAGIISYPELLLMQLPKESRLRKSVYAIQQSGERAAAVVADLLTVARGVASARESANLNTLITEYLDSPEFNKLIELYPGFSCEQELSPDLLNVSCSPVHIRKCIMNLITNAAEAVDNDGHIFVTTINQYIDQPVSAKDFIAKGEYVVVRVHDTGSGISEKDLNHIFEPFYSKKVMGRSGTGLGLAVVWNTMQDHDGAITVSSDKTGTTFELYFPATREKTLGTEENIQFDDLHGKGEQILIIDDESQQRDIGKRILTSLGYTVYSVKSGEQAVEFLRDKSIDLLILDMIMDPGMNGLETYRQILASHPGQKAVISSGFSGSSDVEETLRIGAGRFIKKPYSIEQLGYAVHQELAL